MFNAKITEISFMNFPHMVTEHGECTKWWNLVTDSATVLKQLFICLLDLFIAEHNLVLPLKKSVSEHPVTKLFIRLDGIRKYNLKYKNFINARKTMCFKCNM